MKKTFLFFTIFCVANIANSQDFRLGISVNPIIGWISEDDVSIESNGATFGFEGGLNIENYFANNYAFNTGIKLSSIGGKLKYNQPYTSDEISLVVQDEVKYKMQYITVPLGLKLRTNQMGYFTWYALLGFSPQVNIGAKAAVDGRSDDINVQKEVGLFNVSYHIGGGLEYGIGGNTALNFGIIYNNSFVDILPDQADKERLNFITFQVGVIF
ncbi:MAG: PorT family protein [Bacteroidales bacterium]|nr:PorT family protein [Bacteroidales bacterium]